MAIKSELLFHPESRDTVQTWRGFCWPALWLNGLWPLRQGLPGIALLTLGLTIVTGGLAWLVIPFVANDLHRTALLDRGYVPCLPTGFWSGSGSPGCGSGLGTGLGFGVPLPAAHSITPAETTIGVAMLRSSRECVVDA